MAKPNKSKPKAKVQKARAPKPKAKHAANAKAPKAVKKVAKPPKAKAPAKATASKPKVQTPKTPAHKPAKAAPTHKTNGITNSRNDFQAPPKFKPPVKLNPFLTKQKDRLLQLRDGMLDSMMGVAKDNLRSRAEGSEASAFGMHQADAGSDAYDRDFALSLLSQEQDALYEIDEALKRLDAGTYGVCEMSGKPIPHARLEAIPFARFTVECQSQLEKQNKLSSRTRQPVTSLFGLTDDEGGDSDEEETPVESKE